MDEKDAAYAAFGAKSSEGMEGGMWEIRNLIDSSS